MIKVKLTSNAMRNTNDQNHGALTAKLHPEVSSGVLHSIEKHTARSTTVGHQPQTHDRGSLLRNNGPLKQIYRRGGLVIPTEHSGALVTRELRCVAGCQGRRADVWKIWEGGEPVCLLMDLRQIGSLVRHVQRRQVCVCV